MLQIIYLLCWDATIHLIAYNINCFQNKMNAYCFNPVRMEVRAKICLALTNACVLKVSVAETVKLVRLVCCIFTFASWSAESFGTLITFVRIFKKLHNVILCWMSWTQCIYCKKPCQPSHIWLYLFLAWFDRMNLVEVYTWKIFRLKPITSPSDQEFWSVVRIKYLLYCSGGKCSKNRWIITYKQNLQYVRFYCPGN